MLRYSLTFLSIQIIICAIQINVLFAQTSGGANGGAGAETQRAETQRLNNRNLANMKFPNGLLTTIGRSYYNALDKGLPSSTLIFEGVRKEEFRKSLGITEEQSKQFETLRTEVQFQMFTKVPDLIKRFDNTTENNTKTIQNEVEADIQKFIGKINAITTPEQQTKAKELLFQMTGGINSPLINNDMLDVLELTGEQRKNAEIIIEQTKNERNRKFDELMKIVEEGAEKGRNISKDERNEIRKKRENLINEIFALGKKNGDRLKAFLNDKQIKKAEELIENAPDFLPKFPKINNNQTTYIPNADSWKPGQDIPDSEKNKKQNRKIFPRKKNNE
ncbi:MAG: hypothetical protein LBP59_04135 [Planctomycetaceae bacterium]|jgi:hypothetical protein|nr:hypothetical protein [Planctomycetaceae bacterium]